MSESAKQPWLLSSMHLSSVSQREVLGGGGGNKAASQVLILLFVLAANGIWSSCCRPRAEPVMNRECYAGIIFLRQIWSILSRYPFFFFFVMRGRKQSAFFLQNQYDIRRKCKLQCCIMLQPMLLSKNPIFIV